MNIRSIRLLTIGLCLALSASFSFAQHLEDGRVDLRFNHLYTYEEMTEALHDLVDAYPELLSIESIGQSVGGRELWLVTLNNPDTGPHTSKAAMYIDGNIHGNEVQAAEVVLYTIWYLTRGYGQVDAITELVDQRAFYLLPMANPDGRAIFFDTAGTLRGGIKPTDNDYDGLYDEDWYDDLDGDGHITLMWKRDPLGRYERDPEDDRFFRRVDDDAAPGGWTRLGREGIDNDGDGDVNEDGPGGYDPNRNWPSDWQPNYIQFGAGEYPFSLPETRAVGEFLMAHPNVAAMQSYHNTGGMILRGPATSYITYPGGDARIMRELQETGERMIPFYRAYVTHEDLYTVHGGEKGWTYEGLGIISFTNELWTSRWMYKRDDRLSDEEEREYRDLLEFGAAYVPYKEIEHPTYGTVLVGGTKKWARRIPPPWMLEEELHRNFAFTMHHADQMPLLRFGHLQVQRTAGGLWEVTIEVANDRLIPTITQQAQREGIGARDVMLCETGRRARVVASGTVNSLLPWATLDAQDSPQPQRLWNERGVWSHDSDLFRFLIEGTGTMTLTYKSEKGGTLSIDVPLEEREAAPVTPARD